MKVLLVGGPCHGQLVEVDGPAPDTVVTLASSGVVHPDPPWDLVTEEVRYFRRHFTIFGRRVAFYAVGEPTMQELWDVVVSTEAKAVAEPSAMDWASP